ADARSRHPSDPPAHREVADDEVDFDGRVVHACSSAMIRTATSVDPIDPLLQDLKVHADRCVVYQEVKNQIREGFPSAKKLLSDRMKPFWKIRHQLSIDDHELKQRPERPFHELAIDLATVHGREFLILVDCATEWPDILDLGHDTTSLKLISALKGVFCRTGAPTVLWSDNGPQ
ncbi:hypothetical protein TCAL_12687, partial [Tigriopus californicus]